MNVQAKPLTEITHIALHVLLREIGISNTMHFLGQFTPGTGNYTEERNALFKDLSMDDILNEVKKQPTE